MPEVSPVPLGRTVAARDRWHRVAGAAV